MKTKAKIRFTKTLEFEGWVNLTDPQKEVFRNGTEEEKSEMLEQIRYKFSHTRKKNYLMSYEEE